MTFERIAMRLDETDRMNLTTIAAALNTKAADGRLPFAMQATITRCLRAALKVAAAAASTGALIGAA